MSKTKKTSILNQLSLKVIRPKIRKIRARSEEELAGQLQRELFQAIADGRVGKVIHHCILQQRAAMK